MTDETTTEQLAEIDRDMADIERQVAELVEEAQRADYPQPEPEPQPIQVREGRWRTRGGAVKNIRPCEPLRGAYFVWPWTDGVMTFQDNGRHQGSKESPNDLVEYLGPIEPDKTQELDGKTQELPDKTQELPEYTPPEGWRLVRFGELLLPGDEIVQIDDRRRYPTHRIGDAVGPNQQYIRRIKPEPQAESQPQPEPVQVREGRWRTRGGDIRNVTPRPAGDGRKDLFPWWDAAYGGTWTSGGRYYFGEESPSDLVEYLGPIEQQPEPEPEPVQVPGSGEQIRLLKDCNARQAELIADLKYERSGAMERAEVSARSNRKLTEQIEELRSEVSYVQRLLGESRQRVTHLEDLVGSLRTINEAQEKAFERAGEHNSDLQSRLNAVCSEWVQQAETIRRLQIELDAAQQVSADSPELRQLRADLAEVTRERDQYLDSYQRIFGDLETIRETTKATTVEAIAEWLEPIRAVDNEHLANEALQHLPQIMRHLTGLDSHEEME